MKRENNSLLGFSEAMKKGGGVSSCVFMLITASYSAGRQQAQEEHRVTVLTCWLEALGFYF